MVHGHVVSQERRSLGRSADGAYYSARGRPSLWWAFIANTSASKVRRKWPPGSPSRFAIPDLSELEHGHAELDRFAAIDDPLSAFKHYCSPRSRSARAAPSRSTLDSSASSPTNA